MNRNKPSAEILLQLRELHNIIDTSVSENHRVFAKALDTAIDGFEEVSADYASGEAQSRHIGFATGVCAAMIGIFVAFGTIPAEMALITINALEAHDPANIGIDPRLN